MKKHNFHSGILSIVAAVMGGFAVRASQDVQVAGVLGALTILLMQGAREKFGSVR